MGQDGSDGAACDTRARMAGIAYHGVAGSSYDCLDAIRAILQCRIAISAVRILTSNADHALLLFTDLGDPIAIKTGFSSGYGGAGPHALSMALALLNLFGAVIEEVGVDPEVIDRLDQSALDQSDLDRLSAQQPVRPARWADYVTDDHFEHGRDGALLRQMPPVMPFAVIDPRIMDLARTFWEDSDARLTLGYRRLEDRVRERTGLKTSSARLFGDAFGEEGPLTWPTEDTGERTGRLQLFTGAFLAFRNPRAHRVPTSGEALAEFLLLNQLYLLEAQAIAIHDLDQGSTGRGRGKARDAGSR